MIHRALIRASAVMFSELSVYGPVATLGSLRSRTDPLGSVSMLDALPPASKSSKTKHSRATNP